MKTVNRVKLAVRYFSGHYRRYIFLILAVSFGFAIITTMTSLAAGMYDNVYRAAQQHYGGQLFVLGFHKQYGHLGLIRDDQAVMDAVRKLDVQPDRMVKRTLFFADGILYFAGNSSRQKNVYGVDWDVEADDFAKLDYSEGGSANLSDGKGIIISEPVAEQLGARVGDDVVLKVRTKTGQNNTGTFVIKGIFRDESIFGYYKCYVDRRELNNLLAFEEEDYFSLGLYFNNAVDASELSFQLHSELEKKLPMSSFITRKEEYTFEQGMHWEGIRHFVMTLEIFVSQVSELLTAMNLVSYFLYIMISLIVLVSVSVTYRLIIHERTAEIGTMRSMGFQRGDILGILLGEALLVFAVSLVIGALLSLLVLWIISLFSFSFIPGFEIFMTKGRLLPLFTISDILSNIGLLIIIIFPALLIPSFRASRLELTKALGD
ncbi:MAG: ABC transporter permease [Spirochaetaceae bacterium]|nr:ABC transporter permease [Spirochaetaceae bacterium]